MKATENKDKHFMSFVVCSYNEEATIGSFFTELYQFAEKSFESWEIIVVNNGSSDQTVQQLQLASAPLAAGVIVVNLPWRHDSELAMLAGTDLAVGDLVFEIESSVRDWPMSILSTLFETCLEGTDIVSASPDKRLEFGSRLFYFVLNKVSYLKLDLTTEELRIVSRRALNAVLSAKETIRYRKALYKSSGFPSQTIKYSPLRPVAPRTEDGFFRRIGLAFDVLISFSNIGFRLAVIFSISFFLVSASIGLYAVNSYFFRQTIASGWTTLALFLSFGFSGVFLVLGLLGKYLSIVLVEIQKRPPYRVQTIKRMEKN